MLISILPFRILYIFSDFIYLIFYYIIGYRKNIVLNNLKIAFPNKSDDEIKVISKKFFHHFVDIFMEMLKTFTISKKEIAKHFYLTNLDEFVDFTERNPNFILMSSHYANYEWILSLNRHFDFPVFGAYKKLKNPYFDNFIKRSRGRFNTKLITTKEFIQLFKNNKENNISGLYGFLNDQSPKLKKSTYYTTFFGKSVPVYTGAEMLAKKYNYPMVYLRTEKIKRGYYRTTVHVLSENPVEIPDFQLTDLFMRNLEKQIVENPEYYFWTHKRFKHAK
jgi:KDO2-lipid IV(A) lauroyltransferase